MASRHMRECIGICGVIGSGKSYVAELIARERNYRLIKADDVFKNKVLTNPEYVEKFSEFIEKFAPDITPFEDGVYQSKAMTSLMFNGFQRMYDFPILKAINKFNYCYIRDAIQEESLHRDCIIEMATLPTFGVECGNELRITTQIMVMGDSWTHDFDNDRNHEKRIRTRDSRDDEVISNILEYQTRRLKPFTSRGTGVFHLENIDTVNVQTGRTNFMPDGQILHQFDQIAMSSQAMSFARIPQNS